MLPEKRIFIRDRCQPVSRPAPAGFFPKIFGTTEDQPLDIEAVKAEFEKLTQTINQTYKSRGMPPMSAEDVALGFLRVANEAMARPIREISVMRGYDIKSHVLACFGGAGGQHACAIARQLGISRIFIHRFAGILSAYGMGLADIVAEKQEPAAVTLTGHALATLDQRLERLADAARNELEKQGFDDQDIQVKKYLNLRYQGTDTPMMIQKQADADFISLFRAAHVREFGFDLTGREIVADDIRVRAVAKSANLSKTRVALQSGAPVPDSVKPCYFEGAWRATNIYVLDRLGAGCTISGPAIIMQDTSTILIAPGCRAMVTDSGDVVIDVLTQKKEIPPLCLDPVRLSIFSHLFMSIAEQMGRTLEKTAISTNIKNAGIFPARCLTHTGAWWPMPRIFPCIWGPWARP